MLVADSGFAVTIDQIAQSLRHDHVLVQEVIGDGDARGTHDRLSRLVERLERDRGVAAYVALVLQPRDVDAGAESAEYLTQALHNRLEQPGIYVVATTRSTLSIQTFGLPQVEDADLSLLASANADSVRHRIAGDYETVGDTAYLVPGVRAETALLTALHPLDLDITKYRSDAEISYPPTLSAAELDDLADRQRELDPPDPDYDHEAEPLSTGARWTIGSTAGMFVLLVVQQSLRGWPGWHRRPARPARRTRSRRPAGTGPRPDRIERARSRARTELAQLTTELTTALTTAPTTASQDPDLLESASTAREAAEHYVDSDRLDEVAGAYALAVTGRSDLARAADPAARAVRLCFFDPLHGRATGAVTSPLGDALIDVPACRQCARAVRSGRRPQVMTGSGRGAKPYYETDSVWARTGFGSIVDDFARQVLASRRHR